MTYDGGNPAVVATVSGETEATTQLTVEEAEMIRGKKLRALAVIGDKAIELDGYGTIEPLTRTIPSFKAPANYFGIFIPKTVPPEVIATVEKMWADNIVNSKTLKEYATSRGAQFAPIAGAEAQRVVMPAVQANAWMQFDGGKAKVSPDTVGISRPTIAGHMSTSYPVAPRTDLRGAFVWIAVGAIVVFASWRMDRLTQQGAELFTAPGLWPGVIGLMLALLGGILAWRSLAAGARRRMACGRGDDTVYAPKSQFALAAAMFLYLCAAARRSRPAVLARHGTVRDGVRVRVPSADRMSGRSTGARGAPDPRAGVRHRDRCCRLR